MQARPTTPIDALVATVGGRYEDDLVTVQAGANARPRRGLHGVRTAHFDIVPVAGRLSVTHTIPTERIDDDLAGLIVEELFAPGWVRGSEMFERIFTGIVRSSAVDALDSWELFYRNTFRKLGDRRDRGSEPGASSFAEHFHGSIAGYAPVYDHACELVLPGSALELGCCFGFLSLRLAAEGHLTTASDVSAGTTRLLAAVAPRLGITLDTIFADAARMPVPARSAENVLVIHLLEHLEPEHGSRVVAEAVRCARGRVVVAVPLEEEADESYGHVRTVSLDDLRTWGAATARPFDVHEHHGGWLVIETAVN